MIPARSDRKAGYGSRESAIAAVCGMTALAISVGIRLVDDVPIWSIPIYLKLTISYFVSQSGL